MPTFGNLKVKKSKKSKKPLVFKALDTQIKKVVKRQISSNLEVKVANFNAQYSLTGANSSGGYANWLQPLTPYTAYLTVAQGVGQGSRIGNSIKVKRQRLKIAMWPNDYDVTENPLPIPQIVTIYIFKAPNEYLIQSVSDIIDTTYATFYQSGSSSVGAVGSLLDSLQDVNKEIIKLYYKKSFKLGFANSTGTGSSAAYQHYANNDYKLNHLIEIDITKYVPKEVNWNDTATIIASGTVWMFIESVPATGAIQGVAYYPGVYQYQNIMEYTDA